MSKSKPPWSGVIEYMNDLVKRIEALEARIAPDPSQPADDGCTKCGANEDVRPHSGPVRLCFSCGAEPTKTPLKVGDRVKRGPDWKTLRTATSYYGKVTHVGAGNATVAWDSGQEANHDYGADGRYQIEKLEAKPVARLPLKVGDRVKIVSNSRRALDCFIGSLGTLQAVDGDGDCKILPDDERDGWWFAPYDIEKIEAEPQVEYLLSTYEAHEAWKKGFQVSCEIGHGSGNPWDMLYAGYRWRIVPAKEDK